MNKRVFVKKKNGFLVESISLLKELKENLQENSLEKVEIYNTYDIFNCNSEELELLKTKILSEAVADEVFLEINLDGQNYLAIEFLPGQYDQRADSAEQCLALLGKGENVSIKSGRVIVFTGNINSFEKIKAYLINPIEARTKDLTLLSNEENIEIEPVKFFTGFIDFSETELLNFLKENSLAMTINDLKHIQNYFKNIENRNPSETEIKVLDTYWSDHCRHTTFETFLENITFESGTFTENIQQAFENYLEMRKNLGRENKAITLMDMATIGAKTIRANGDLEDLEISDEINACSIEIDVDVDGITEKYLLMFKNETHNHPTEIEPFGGASTCIGGAIRDPLSGRAYVYQAMRITGSGDITTPMEKTLENKLPQMTISKGAAHGYSSYGNQIGLATTFVREIYHPGYVAKRMEVGAVVGAVKKEYVRREEPNPGDIVVVLGGRTGRDGVGGATGSSKEHTDNSLSKCSSEVQKGNAPVERRIQRLFRNPEVTKLIKKSNDFGAGGVSVAIGEIAAGVDVNLDALPVKYAGLNGTDLAISESQERMAVVIEADQVEKFQKLVQAENLESAVVATVTEVPRLVIRYKNEKIVDIAREFLDTNGATNSQNVTVTSCGTLEEVKEFTESSFKEMLTNVNVASQRGMVEMFDATIGRSTVLMPYGGMYQLTPSEASVQKIATEGYTETASILSFGYNPFVSEYSPYLGAIYAVVESLNRLTAVGGDYKKARLSFQEYFEKLGDSKEKWGKPFQALLGALEAQIQFNTPAIGGKDSMSGTFKNINVPPTLISFAVTTEKVKNIISAEFKSAKNYVYLIEHVTKSNSLPNYTMLKENMEFIHENILNGKILSASTVSFGGWGETALKMGLGNRLGAELHSSISPLKPLLGSFLIESEVKLERGTLLGLTNKSEILNINGINLNLNEGVSLLESKFEKIYNYNCEAEKSFSTRELTVEKNKNITRKAKAENLVEKPKVLITVFPGTNSEYDTERAFKMAGAETEIFVFNNLTLKNIDSSIDTLCNKLETANIFMIPGGFSAGDEPDGSGKFIANILQNPKVKVAVQNHLNKEGLILGICNGFQALVKSGLLPYGDVDKLSSNAPTLFRNDINRHVSRMINTKIVSNSSPWLSSYTIGDIHKLPVSHGEGKFVISPELFAELSANNQIATQYCTETGDATMDKNFNLNGSHYAVEGILSSCGQIFGKMAHSERYEEGVFKNISGNKLQDIFLNGVNYFKK
ncbi:MAG: phosphoribosylformylglycinamidine synthase [Fusobacteriaceae bacterium]